MKEKHVNENKVQNTNDKLIIKKILVIDDDLPSRVLIEEFLLNQGIDVISFDDGIKAINLFKKQNDFDLIILDIQMPKLGGCEVIKEIRKIDQNIPIIAYTAYYDTEIIKKCLDIGFNDILIKPIDTKSLLKLIKKYSKF